MIDLTPLLQAFAALVCTLLSAVIIPFIKSRIGQSRLECALAWVRIAVMAAEQLYPPGAGADKKAYALKVLNRRGFTFDEETLSALVESAVHRLRSGKLTCEEDAPCRF